MELVIAVLIALPFFVVFSFLMTYIDGVKHKKLSPKEKALMNLPFFLLMAVGVFSVSLLGVWSVLVMFSGVVWTLSIGVYYTRTKPNLWDVEEESIELAD